MWSGENSRRSSRISRGGTLHRKGERNSSVMPPFPESPRCLSPFQGNLFACTASTFKPSIDSHHGGTWDSRVGKPRGKTSRESHRSLDPCEVKSDTGATAREESARACPHSGRGVTPWGDSRSSPRSISAQERNPQVPAPTPHKVLGPGIDGRGIPRGSRAYSHGDWRFLRPPERVPEVPVLSREHQPQLEKIPEVLTSRRDEAHFR